MDDRLLLDKIDFNKGTVKIGNEEFKLNDTNFPTIDKDDPYKLTDEESEIVRIRFLFVSFDRKSTILSDVGLGAR